MRSSNFRYDINALRALAVMGVIIFHYNPFICSGGFVGVDIFFVISGYLITSIICKRLINSNFSLFNFYRDRAKRIIPALLTICIISIIIGYFLFEPMLYKTIGIYSFNSLLFISNFTYWNETSYFDISAQYKLLLHTWSLSVEWQFYLLYPVFFLIFFKIFNLYYTKYIILIIAIISFILNIYCITYYPTTAFFLLPTRMWELLIGGIAFLYPIQIPTPIKKYINLIVIGSIVISFIYIPSIQIESGYWIIFPAIAAYIYIINQYSHHWLHNKIIYQLGNSSYSIYLVHWPIIVFFKIMGISLHIYLYVTLVCVMTYLLHHYIEKKRNYHYKTIIIYGITLIVAFLISLNGAAYRVSNPFYSLDQKAFHLKYYGGTGVPSGTYIYHLNPPNSQPLFILTGDSHARQYVNFLKERNYNFVAYFTDGCLGLHDFYIDAMPVAHDPKFCTEQYSKLLFLLKQYPHANLIIAQRWDIYTVSPFSFYHSNKKDNKAILFNHLKQQLSLLMQDGGNQRRYFIIGRTFQNEERNDNGFICRARNELFIYKYIHSSNCPTYVHENAIESTNSLSDIIHNLAINDPNIYFIDPNSALCHNKKCQLNDKDHNPLLSDIDHLSIYGANIVGQYIWNIVDQKLSSQ